MLDCHMRGGRKYWVSYRDTLRARNYQSYQVAKIVNKNKVIQAILADHDGKILLGPHQRACHKALGMLVRSKTFKNSKVEGVGLRLQHHVNYVF